MKKLHRDSDGRADGRRTRHTRHGHVDALHRQTNFAHCGFAFPNASRPADLIAALAIGSEATQAWQT